MRRPEIEVTPATAEHLDALIEGDHVFTERFGMTVEPGYMDLPDSPGIAEQALAFSKKALDDGTPAEWFSHLFVEPGENRVIGFGGYKGEPRESTVEIGYALAEAYRGAGRATEAARELIRRAQSAGVSRVIAHTLPERNPSIRLLERLGFRMAEEVVDPQDGTVWRWELALPAG
jgi:RimJ/RimL family protein N-acetyltransferase